MVATGGSSARVPGHSFGSEAFSPAFIARAAASLGRRRHGEWRRSLGHGPYRSIGVGLSRAEQIITTW
jgi:hypothetical protein